MPNLSELTDYEMPAPEPIPANIPRVYIDSPGIEDRKEEKGIVQKVTDKLLGLNGEERYQLWPEKVVREGLSAAGDVFSGQTPQWGVDPVTGDVHTSPQMIEKAQAISALAGTGGLAGAEEGAVLNATPSLRPALKYKDKLYKGKPGQEHQDVIPAHLYPEFQDMAMKGEDISHYNFGFVNDKGHFLNREDALKYGIDSGLIDPQAGKFGALTSTLMADSSKPGTAIEAMAKADPFFSALEHNVSKIGQSKMTGDQWLGTLSNKPGVKPEELDWTGLKSFLQENGKAPVTKEQIEQHLAANKVELKEVNKGTTFKHLSDDEKQELDSLRSRQHDDDFDVHDLERLDELQSKGKYELVSNTKYHSYQLPGGPLSRDTEILTNKGWKRIDAVEIGDVVMTRKDETGILEWQPVQATPKVYAENLYHFFSQSINMRVTENHQMIAKKRRRNSEGLQRLTAKELWGKSEMLVPLTGVWEGGEADKIFGFDPNDLAELFGWYLAEGSYKHKNGNKHTIQIAQCKEYNPEKCERIEALLDRMGLPWRYYGEAYGIGTKTVDKDLAELFHEQPTSEFKFIPYFFFNQNKSVIHSLLDGLILGDGCTSEQEGRLDKTTFFTKSEQLAGDVQILILMIGKNANVRQRPSGLYCVGIKSKEWSSVDEAKFEIAPYNDFAFCVTVENHAIYVRRNGVAAFTGNSNYREMLMTLPNTTKTLDQIATEKGFGGWHSGLTAEQKAEVFAAQDKQGKPSDNYKSSHWDEPNILAHVRMNDRTIDGKKSLHLEEIQSDWHQQGRDKGYQQSLTDAEQKELNTLKEARNKKGGITGKYLEKYVELSNKDYAAKNSSIPDAPFKKTWHELALKRMIREAAEKGYDRLSWTPGEAQAARYDLSKQVDKIAVPMVNENGTRSVRIDSKTDIPFKLMVDKEGKVTGAGGSSDQFSGKPLSDVVGKEMADKIMKLEKPNEFSGEGLKIGGEGMKGFYDSIIPKAVEKLGKEHGVKVKQVNLTEAPKYEMKTFDRSDNGKETVSVYKDGVFLADMEKSEAKHYIETKQKSDKPPTAHYIDIPPSLRDTAIGKGFPLFSSSHMFTPVAHDPFNEKKK